METNEIHQEKTLRKLGMIFMMVSIILLYATTYFYFKDLKLVKIDSCQACEKNNNLQCKPPQIIYTQTEAPLSADEMEKIKKLSGGITNG